MRSRGLLDGLMAGAASRAVRALMSAGRPARQEFGFYQHSTWIFLYSCAGYRTGPPGQHPRGPARRNPSVARGANMKFVDARHGLVSAAPSW